MVSNCNEQWKTHKRKVCVYIGRRELRRKPRSQIIIQSELPAFGSPKTCPCWGRVDEKDYLDEGKRDTSKSRGIHKFLEILVQKLKNQVEFVFCVDDIQQPRERRSRNGGEGENAQMTQTEGTFFIVKHLPGIYLLDNIRVVKFLKQRDLSYGSTGYTLCLTWRGWESRNGNVVTNIPFSPAQSFFSPHQGDSTPMSPRKIRRERVL